MSGTYPLNAWLKNSQETRSRILCLLTVALIILLYLTA